MIKVPQPEGGQKATRPLLLATGSPFLAVVVALIFFNGCAQSGQQLSPFSESQKTVIKAGGDVETVQTAEQQVVKVQTELLPMLERVEAKADLGVKTEGGLDAGTTAQSGLFNFAMTNGGSAAGWILGITLGSLVLYLGRKCLRLNRSMKAVVKGVEAADVREVKQAIAEIAFTDEVQDVVEGYARKMRKRKPRKDI